MIGLGIQRKESALGTGKAVGESDSRSAAAIEALSTKLRSILGDRFEVLEHVAVGGMAVIFRLQHRYHGGIFAAKVLHGDLAVRPEVVASFRREGVLAARLGDHPNAIPILDAGEKDGVYFLLMPFVEGEDLDLLLRQSGPLAREEALHMAAQIGSLLCHAESHGIAHCDLAPGNIRLDIFGRYRLMDFGIAQTSEGNEPRAVGGTPLYTSPEQIRGERTDVRADIYALGLVVAEVLTGKPILQGTSLAEVKKKHLDAEWTLPESVLQDEALARLLRRMTAQDREQRFRSAFELSGALAALGFDRPEFRPRPKGTRTGAPATRRTRLS